MNNAKSIAHKKKSQSNAYPFLWTVRMVVEIHKYIRYKLSHVDRHATRAPTTKVVFSESTSAGISSPLSVWPDFSWNQQTTKLTKSCYPKSNCPEIIIVPLNLYRSLGSHMRNHRFSCPGPFLIISPLKIRIQVIYKRSSTPTKRREKPWSQDHNFSRDECERGRIQK